MRLTGADDFRRASRALDDLGARQVQLATYRGLRRGGEPLGPEMVQAGAAAMPHHGGLAAAVARTQVSTTGGPGELEIRLQSPDGYALAAFDAGDIRHPVFARAGRPRVWADQRVTAGAFSKPLQAGARRVQAALRSSLQQAVDDAARRV